jgi:hypothetical protein
VVLWGAYIFAVNWVGETIVDNQGSEDCKPSGNQGWLRSINKNFGHPSELM